VGVEQQVQLRLVQILLLGDRRGSADRVDVVEKQTEVA